MIIVRGCRALFVFIAVFRRFLLFIWIRNCSDAAFEDEALSGSFPESLRVRVCRGSGEEVGSARTPPDLQTRAGRNSERSQRQRLISAAEKQTGYQH